MSKRLVRAELDAELPSIMDGDIPTLFGYAYTNSKTREYADTRKLVAPCEAVEQSLSPGTSYTLYNGFFDNNFFKNAGACTC